MPTLLTSTDIKKKYRFPDKPITTHEAITIVRLIPNQQKFGVTIVIDEKDLNKFLPQTTLIEVDGDDGKN